MEAGTQFDPKLVEIMLGLIEKGLIDIDNLYKDGEKSCGTMILKKR